MIVKACFPEPAQSAIAITVSIECTRYESVKSVNDARSSDSRELDVLLLARLESHCGARGDVESHAIGCRAIEFQSSVSFEKVVMAADLDRSIPPVSHQHTHCASGTVGCDGT
jgi:hypothetical protein